MSRSKYIRERIIIPITVDGFTINGEPTCMAWYGDEHQERMACRFLAASNFGTKFHCLYCNVRLYNLNNGFLEPSGECPLWGDSDEHDESNK